MPTRQIFLMDGKTRIFDANLEPHFREAASGCERYIYEPDAIGIKTARDMIGPLLLAATDNAHVRGWLDKYLAVCEKHPDATVSVTVIPDPPKAEEKPTPP